MLVSTVVVIAALGQNMQQATVSFSGIMPHLAVTADTAPEVPGSMPKRSEAGVGGTYLLNHLNACADGLCF